MRLLPRFIACWVVPLCLTACRSLTLNSPEDLARLPVSQGVNMGSLSASTSWQYLGSTESTHEFRYYFNRGNSVRHVEVSVPRTATNLEFNEKPIGGAPQWATLDSSEDQLHFSPYVQPPARRLRLKDLFPTGQIPEQ